MRQCPSNQTSKMMKNVKSTSLLVIFDQMFCQQLWYELYHPLGSSIIFDNQQGLGLQLLINLLLEIENTKG